MSIIIQEIEKFNNNVIEKYVKLTTEDKKTITEVLSNLKKGALYNSKIHGIYHSEKVFLFCYLIAKHENLDEVDCQIITDAALYHDIGRINDCEDSLHGYCASYKIEKIVEHPIYKDVENLNILKGIIDGHSVSDDNRDRFIEDYEITEVERYYKLYDILKDADALDRNRFFDYSNSYLDESYLRTDISKQLMGLSKEINDLYKKEVRVNKNNLPTPEIGNFECFHSIGFDFFKLGSVLENGILSKKEMVKAGIKGTSNFEGGNLEDYISVVDARLIDKGGTAFPTFIMNGISFVCEVNELYSSDSKYTKSYCIERGIPYNQSFHDDEKYVYSKIEPENINHIFISNEINKTDIRELMYIYNSLSYEILTERVNYYLNNVSDVINVDLTQMNRLLSAYKKTLDKYHILDQIQKNSIKKQLIAQLEGYRSQINSIIQEWLYQKYRCELGLSFNQCITVDDVGTFELQKLGYECTKRETNKGYVVSFEKIKSKSR
ncbi:MAG: HD domain-containing protein [Bacilli bacterium]|nr:HD domain-containing protein [Bacilli bacterium]MDD4282284.1 HD domain-containing protein [Bacilli bacterium]